MKLAPLNTVGNAHDDSVWTAAWVPATEESPPLLLTGSLDETVRLWNPEGPQKLQTNTGHCLGVVSVAAHPSGRIAASASIDSFIRVFDVATNNTIATLEAPPSEVWQLQFNPQCGCLAGVEVESGVLVVFKCHLVKPVWKSVGLRDVIKPCLGQQRQVIVGGRQAGRCANWTAPSEHQLKRNTDAAIHSEEGFIGIGAVVRDHEEDIVMILCEVSFGTCRYVLRQRKGGGDDGVWVDYIPFSISSEGTTLAAAGGGSASVKLWDTAEWQLTATLSVPRLEGLKPSEKSGSKKFVLSVAWSLDGRQIACGSMDGTISIFDVTRTKFLHHLEGHSMPVRSLVYSSAPLDSRVLFSASDDGHVHVYDTEGKTLISSLSGHAGWVLSVDVSPDGTAIATGSSDRTVRLWDLKMRAATQILTGHTDQVWSVAFGPPSKTDVRSCLLASVSDDKSISFYKYS
ncbi:WD repeat-containing protein VIP3 [Abeliophyllum distichum]|uniref:WD repeat-containing protein VIP3 n=1 Tax=Abeliophyllum distichum TaxID=126358 RepID=A0ABD1QV60_9LAMI